MQNPGYSFQLSTKWIIGIRQCPSSVVVRRQQVALNDNTYNIGLIQECSRVTIYNNSYIKNMAARGGGGGGGGLACLGNKNFKNLSSETGGQKSK